MYKLATKLGSTTSYSLILFIKEINLEIDLDVRIIKIFKNDEEIEKSFFELETITIDDKYYNIFDDFYKYTLEDSWNHNNLTDKEIKLIERELNNFRIDEFKEMIGEDTNLNIVRF